MHTATRIATVLLALRLSVFLVMLMWTLSYRQHLAPFGHLLFFAAWPMLAACFALYALRDLDTLWVFQRSAPHAPRL